MEYASLGKAVDSNVDQNKTQLSPYPPNYGPYPLNSNSIRGYKPSYSKNQTYAPPGLPIIPLKPALKLGYWELLSPALFGTAGALFLSLFSGETNEDLTERSGGNLFKLAIVGYSIVALVSAYYAVKKAIAESRPTYNTLFPLIAGVLVSVILLFAAEDLLLYRYFPSSWTGDVGDNFCINFFSFLYLSSTTMATAGMGDISPANVTARALIALEILFYLFTLATAVPLILVQKD